MSPTPMLRIRPATVGDAMAVSALVLPLAREVVDAPDATAFLATLGPDGMFERLASPRFAGLLAEDGSGACGIILMRDTTHLYHLFVRRDRQGLGIARRLWRAMTGAGGSAQGAPARFTVNSTPSAVEVYRRLGFEATAQMQHSDGISFLPMACERPLNACPVTR
ncbi:GNAT family N-acetyltransferase [Lysobacter maris]|uniref:GNAT family N-acetyltransferase n=1 Tax=Marilutibacter maris TaxID=1605891 RepID=A0A507ZWS4_9GAMM|nr:GNAT family N-acetyltransferase [Lysobacter maris]